MSLWRSGFLLLPATLTFSLSQPTPTGAQTPRIAPLPPSAAVAPQWELPRVLELRTGAPEKQPAEGAVLPGVPCPYVAVTLPWKPAPQVDPPSWQSFVDGLGGWVRMLELLEIDSGVVSDARALQEEARKLRDEDAALESELARLHAELENILSGVDSLGPQICSHNAEVRRYESQCLGRELPPDEYSRCTSWQGQINTRQSSLEGQRQALIERENQANARVTQLGQQQVALHARILSLDQKSKDQPGVATAAARKRRWDGGYEIDTSSLIQLAEKQTGWERVERILVNNRGKVFISGPAEAEAMSITDPARRLARQALMQQWNIRPADKDVPQALSELFANLGVPASGDAEIAASAWKHRRALITGNPADFKTVTCPKFPCLVVEITQGS